MVVETAAMAAMVEATVMAVVAWVGRHTFCHTAGSEPEPMCVCTRAGSRSCLRAKQTGGACRQPPAQEASRRAGGGRHYRGHYSH